MKTDPVIQAVRDARRRISATVDHDPKKLVERYRRLQERHPERLIRDKSKSSKSDEAA